MPPATILIKPASGLCNMRCGYCFYRDVSGRRETESFGIMTPETLETLVRRVFEYAEGYAAFAFQGGEPTLAGLDFFRLLIELQKKYNTKNIQIQNSIQTNGYAVDEDWAEFFAGNNFLVGLSLDGTRELHNSARLGADGKGTYERIMKTAGLFKRHGVEFNILCVVTRGLARRGMKVYESLRGSGFRHLQFIPCIIPPENDDGRSVPDSSGEYSLTAERYASFLKNTFDCYYNDFKRGNFISVRNFDNNIGILLGEPPENCAMAGYCTCYFVAEADGGVYLCDFYVLDEWRIGNIRDSSFTELAKTPRAAEFVAVSRHADPKCSGCRWHSLCRGGCRRDREPFADGKPVLNKYCAAYTEFFEYAYERLAEMAKLIKTRHP